jgi:hypothetical protein
MHMQQLGRISIVVLVLVGCLGLRYGLTQERDRQYRIGFHLFKSGTIYDEALEGIAYEAVLMNSHNDPVQAKKNLQALDEMGLDLLYSLSSDGTQIAKDMLLKTPIIATVINHPASLGVTQTPDAQPLFCQPIIWCIRMSNVFSR